MHVADYCWEKNNILITRKCNAVWCSILKIVSFKHSNKLHSIFCIYKNFSLRKKKQLNNWRRKKPKVLRNSVWPAPRLTNSHHKIVLQLKFVFNLAVTANFEPLDKCSILQFCIFVVRRHQMSHSHLKPSTWLRFYQNVAQQFLPGKVKKLNRFRIWRCLTSVSISNQESKKYK